MMHIGLGLSCPTKKLAYYLNRKYHLHRVQDFGTFGMLKCPPPPLFCCFYTMLLCGISVTKNLIAVFKMQILFLQFCSCFVRKFNVIVTVQLFSTTLSQKCQYRSVYFLGKNWKTSLHSFLEMKSKH